MGDKTLGLIVIGQSPRDDLAKPFEYATGSTVTVKGALDGFSDQDVDRLAQNSKEPYQLVTKLRSGKIVRIGIDKFVPLVGERAQEFHSANVDLIVLACAGEFPDLGVSTLVLQPSLVTKYFVHATSQRKRIAVVSPIPEEVEHTRDRWENDGFFVHMDYASPYDLEQVQQVARRLSGVDVDVVILDGIVHGQQSRNIIRTEVTCPIILPLELTTFAAAQLMA
jgi:protein AroM